MSDAGCSVLTTTFTHSLLLSPYAFLLLLPDEAALSEVAVCVAAGTPVHVRCQQSSKSKAPPTKITARVRAEQPGRSELPSLQEAVRDSDPAMTDQQSRVWRCELKELAK